MSNRPMRWFTPPPIRTASFSRIRIPGVVLRVSNTWVRVPSNALTYLRVVVAVGSGSLQRFDILAGCRSNAAHALHDVQHQPFRLQQRLHLPFDNERDVPLLHFRTVVDEHRHLQFRVERVKDTFSHFHARQYAVFFDDMQQSVVWSPSPISSAKARRIKSAINCSFVSFNVSICTYSIRIDCMIALLFTVR